MYLAVAGMWIVASDTVLDWFVPADLMASLGMLKGLAFVAVTGFLLYRLTYGQIALRVGMEQALLTGTPLAVFELDADGRITRWSARAAALFGVDVDETVGLELSALDAVPDDVGRQLSEPELPATLDVVLTTDAGTRFTTWYVSRPVGAMATLVLVDDRTASHELNERLAQREAQLEELTRRLRELGRQASEADEATRRTLSREMHDELGQVLTAMRMHTGRVAARHPDVADELDGLNGLVDRAIDDVRRVAVALRPPILDQAGLVAALEWLVSDQADEEVPVTLDVEEPAPELLPDRAIHVFRVVQEALTNARRHAHARVVEVSVGPSNGDWVVEVVDDGVGLAAQPRPDVPEGLGLHSMKERAALLGGDLEIVPAAPNGTRVRLRFPREAA